MSRLLNALHVGNFKAFSDSQRIPIKPITLVFGPNSAGKSSFIHSLALAHEAEFAREKRNHARLDVRHTEVGGTAIDLGGYRQFVHRGQLRKGVEWGAEINVSALSGDARFQQLADLLAPIENLKLIIRLGIELNQYDKPAQGAEPRIDSIEIHADDNELMYMARRDKTGATLRVFRLASGHVIFRKLLQTIVEDWTTSPNIEEENFALADNVINDLLPDLIVHVERFLPSSVELSNDEQGETFPEEKLSLVSNGNRSEDLAKAIRFQLPRSLNDLVRGVSFVLAGELRSFKYLGPIRTLPPRHVAFQQNQDENWVSGGNFAWELLRTDESLRERVNQWLAGHPGRDAQDMAFDSMESNTFAQTWMKTPYRLEVTRFYSMLDLKDPLISSFMDRSLTQNERRELLTNELEQASSKLEERYEMQQSKIQEELSYLRPWIEKIQSASSGEERESLISEALDTYAQKSDEEMMDRVLDDYEEARSKAWDFVQSLEQHGECEISELRLLDVNRRTPVSLRDVGVGISQVLPVLALAYGSKRELIAIEQPEIHLHPALQAELGDVFIHSALGESSNTFILETHSEHLILRLMRRMRETFHDKKANGLPSVTPEDIAVLYVEPDGVRSVVRELPLNELGEFVKSWPGGFFEEGLRELVDDA